MSSLARKIALGRFAPRQRRNKYRNHHIRHDGKRDWSPTWTSIAQMNRWTHNLHEHRREKARRARQAGGAA